MNTNLPTPSTTVPSGAPIRQPNEKHCHACGAVLHITAPQCPHCGAVQSLGSFNTQPQIDAPKIIDGVFCRGCGTSIHRTAQTCPKCGARQNGSSPVAESSRNRTTAALLALFLGGFGVHKFYLGSIFLGFIYLIFFWTAIPAIVGVIEGIYYFTLSDDEFSRKFG